KAFANRYWPTKYLLDKDGYLRYAHFGEGAYRETEEVIRELLLEVNSTLAFPPLMEPVRGEDREGAVCYPRPESSTSARLAVALETMPASRKPPSPTTRFPPS